METDINALIEKAEAFIKEDRYSEAIDAFAEAFILDPYNEKVNERIAFLWQRIIDGNYDFECPTAQTHPKVKSKECNRQHFVPTIEV